MILSVIVEEFQAFPLLFTSPVSFVAGAWLGVKKASRDIPHEGRVTRGMKREE